MSAGRRVQMILPLLHEGQQRVKALRSRFVVMPCGRRWGKTYYNLDWVAEGLLLPARPGQTSLIGATGNPVAYFAPDYKRLTEFWNAATAMLLPITTRVNVQEHRIETMLGTVEMWTLNDPNAGVSRRFRRVSIDEAGLVDNLGVLWERNIRPALMDLEGDALIGGTPRGRNFFWNCWQWANDPTMAEWSGVSMPTSANPYIKASEIAALQQGMTERTYQQEILAAFLDDGGGVFRGVRALSTLSPGEYNSQHTYVIGADWGRTGDFSVFSVIDATAKEQVYVDRFNMVDYEIQKSRLLALCERWHPTAVVAESNSMGTPIIDSLYRYNIPVIPFTATNASKQRIIDALALAFERQDLHLLDDETQRNELEAYEAERLPGGSIRYSAPEGMHDDTVMALALAWDGAATYDWSGVVDTLNSQRPSDERSFANVLEAHRAGQHVETYADKHVFAPEPDAAVEFDLGEIHPGYGRRR